jgi:solute carrier family 5 (sodium-coupled monocarboxylate transporter), member 8/12
MILLLIASSALVNATPMDVMEIVLDDTEWLKYEIMTGHEQESCSEVEQTGGFTVYDYVIVIGMLVISLGIGVFYGFFGKKSGETGADFMLGSDMSIPTVTLSLATSFITAIELLGNPAEVFFNGSQFALIVISMLLVIPLAVIVFYPIYDSMKLTSCYEYLGMRFGKEMRIFGGSLYILQMCFYTSVAVLAPAIALNKATGLNTRLAIALIYIVCIFYSSQGGLKAVVIADTFQAIVLFLSLILILVVGTYLQEGGITSIFTIAKENDRLEMFK